MVKTEPFVFRTSRRKTTSKCWAYFTKTTERMAMCKICSKIYQNCSSTSNLLKHLRVKHAITFDSNPYKYLSFFNLFL